MPCEMSPQDRYESDRYGVILGERWILKLLLGWFPGRHITGAPRVGRKLPTGTRYAQPQQAQRHIFFFI